MESDKTSSRIKEFKNFGRCPQERRREDALKNQQGKRVELLDSYRQLVHETLGGNKKRDLQKFSQLLMLSEWMLEAPEDCETSWIFMLCPQGRRCILKAHQGKTTAIAKSGYKMLEFASPLPGGNVSSHHGEQTTILDCVFNEKMKTFYIIDVLQWNNRELIDTETDCRQFWIQNNIMEEISSTTVKLDGLDYRLLPVETYPCTLSNLALKMVEFPYFENEQPKVDGVLFYHRQAFYTKGNTPLVSWLKPFMLPEVFGDTVSVHPNYLRDRPPNYVNYLKFAEEFGKEHTRKSDKKIYGKNNEKLNLVECELDEMDSSLTSDVDSHDFVDAMDCKIADDEKDS